MAGKEDTEYTRGYYDQARSGREQNCLEREGVRSGGVGGKEMEEDEWLEGGRGSIKRAEEYKR